MYVAFFDISARILTPLVFRSAGLGTRAGMFDGFAGPLVMGVRRLWPFAMDRRRIRVFSVVP